MAGAQIIEAGGNATHRRRLAFRDRVLRERRVDANMHVAVDAAGESQPVLGVEDLLGLLGRNVGGEPRELPILDRDIEAVNRCLIRANYPGVLDDGVELLVHASRSSVCSYRWRLIWRQASQPLHSVCRARSFPACRSPP